MADTVDINSLHNDLVENLLERELIKSKGVEAAFRAVPRHLFLPGVSPEEAYKDQAIPTRFDEKGLAISSSSQPAIMAIMLEQVALQPGQNVLEVGAGTGYNAALMGHLVAEGGHVTTIDIEEEIVTAAREHLEAAGVWNVTVVCGDGMMGYPENGPYDAIILTVGGWEIAPAWLEQLKPNGRIVLPLSLNGPQISIAFERTVQGLSSRHIAPCGFMRLRGPNAAARTTIALNEEKTVYIGYEDGVERPHLIDAGRVKGWLGAPGAVVTTGIAVEMRELWRSFLLWAALHEPEVVELAAKEAGVERIPMLMGGEVRRRWAMSVGLVGQGGMAFFVRLEDGSPPEQPPVPAGPEIV